ncbi:MAG TPA: peptidase MA family metallohydrolase [Myxococcaceae bacterium]|nr:peptidase MA family metallohydrolase [Myxococcaceae bacterium]
MRALILTFALAGPALLLPGVSPVESSAGRESVSVTPIANPTAAIVRPSLIAGAIDTPRFRIIYTANAKGAARKLAAEVETSRDYFRRVLGRDWPGRTEIRVGLGRQEFADLAIPGDKPADWNRAYSYPAENIIVLEARSLTDSDGDATLRHEFLHVALGQLGGDWPHWFHDGLAMFLTGQRSSISQYAALFQAVQQDRIFSFQDLKDRWPEQPSDVEIAYAQSVSFVAFLVERHGTAALGELIDGVVAGRPFETAFARTFKASIWFEEMAWRAQLPSRYSWLPIVANSSTLWALLACVCIAASLRLRARRLRRRREMAAAELAEAEALARLAVRTEENASAEIWDLSASNDNVEIGGDGGTSSKKSSS